MYTAHIQETEVNTVRHVNKRIDKANISLVHHDMPFLWTDVYHIYIIYQTNKELKGTEP